MSGAIHSQCLVKWIFLKIPKVPRAGIATICEDQVLNQEGRNATMLTLRISVVCQAKAERSTLNGLPDA